MPYNFAYDIKDSYSYVYMGTLSKAMATEQLPTPTMSPSPTDATKPSTDSYGHVADMKYTDEVKNPEYNHYNAAPDYKTHSYSAPSY